MPSSKGFEHYIHFISFGLLLEEKKSCKGLSDLKELICFDSISDFVEAGHGKIGSLFTQKSGFSGNMPSINPLATFLGILARPRKVEFSFQLQKKT